MPPKPKAFYKQKEVLPAESVIHYWTVAWSEKQHLFNSCLGQKVKNSMTIETAGGISGRQSVISQVGLWPGHEG